ncbi:hypothetical protein E2F47_22170 [Mycobacterium eburneum]|nr:hypothetical protein [Mycobacterium eburneum]TDH48874.1 hypothetical protein E2F47_22170 [Mycobacterium eburneum]
MPRPDAAKILADSWHALQHPDGAPRRLMHMSNFGRHPKFQPAVTKLAGELGVAAIHTLERAGFTITHRDDPKPADLEDYKIVHLKCGRCGQQVAAFSVSADMTATFNRIGMKTFQAVIDHPDECRPA